MQSIPKIIVAKKPMYKKIAEDVDFYQLFEQIEKKFLNCFLFESLGEEEKFSRYSLMGFDPSLVIRAKGNDIYFGKTKYCVANPYYAMREMMPDKTITEEFAGGLVGYLGYDAINYFEPSIHVKTHDLFDQFMFGVYLDGIILDKLTNEMYYFSHGVDRSSTVEILLHRKEAKKQSLRVSFLRDGLTKEEHMRIVNDVKGQIRSGNTFQCEVGFKTEYRVTGNTLLIYERLRKINPSPFMYYVKFGNKKIIGASPELLFSLRDEEMTTKPLAGTIRRGKTEREDQQLVRQLLHDQKEQAEHKMLVDMQRNDIGRVAEFGSVKIHDLMNIKRFSHVQHISSTIVGHIRPDEDMFSGLASNFPMGTASGTPKVESIKIIDCNEPDGRGPYAGGVGHFGFNSECTFALTLRSVFISGTAAYTQTSGGIVADSVPEREYQEIQHKSAAMKKVLGV